MVINLSQTPSIGLRHSSSRRKDAGKRGSGCESVPAPCPGRADWESELTVMNGRALNKTQNTRPLSNCLQSLSANDVTREGGSRHRGCYWFELTVHNEGRSYVQLKNLLTLLEREGGRGRERQTDRQTETKTERQKDRQRQRDRDREIDDVVFLSLKINKYIEVLCVQTRVFNNDSRFSGKQKLNQKGLDYRC